MQSVQQDNGGKRIKFTDFPRSSSNNVKKQSIIQRLSSVTLMFDSKRLNNIYTVTQEEFHELRDEPISNEDEKLFSRYFTKHLDSPYLTIAEFEEVFQIRPIIRERILRIFDLNTNVSENRIPKTDAIRIMRVLWLSSLAIKTFILFKLLSQDDNDTVSLNDVRTFYEDYLSDFTFFHDQQRTTEIVNTFLTGLFSNDSQNPEGTINFQDFYQIVKRDPSLFDAFHLTNSIDHEQVDKMSYFLRLKIYLKNNIRKLIIITIYLLTVAGLVLYVVLHRIIDLENRSVWPMFARVAGILIHFHFSLAICSMLKQTMALIRKISFIRVLVPIDSYIDAHRFIGTMLVLASLIHTLAYVIYFALDGKHSWGTSMFTTATGLGWVHGSATITGVILFVLFIPLFIFSLQVIRQRPGYHTIFYFTHLLLWPIFILLIIHAETFWKWSIGPMSIFLIEKLYLLKRYWSKYGRTHIKSVRLEDERVITLYIKRPNNFRFRIGEYINICLPKINVHEWHPFTICSSPEQMNFIRLCILKKKNWTKRLFDYFASLSHLNDRFDHIQQATTTIPEDKLYPREILLNEKNRNSLILIEGPFSTSTSYIFDCEHVILIGAGIGITPYISALESLVNRLRMYRCSCIRCGAINYNTSLGESQRLKKIDFIWVNREISNFAWFRSSLEELEQEQETYLKSFDGSFDDIENRRYLDIYLYCTSMQTHQQASLNNLPYELISTMYSSIKKQDMHSLLKTRMRFGRPPWKLLFSKFCTEKRTARVFFTGNKLMGDDIERYCNQFKFSYQHEPYD